MLAPAGLFVVRLPIRHVAVHECKQCTAFNFFKRHRNDRILMLVGELLRTPRLHDAFTRNELEIPAGDVAIPGKHFGATSSDMLASPRVISE